MSSNPSRSSEEIIELTNVVEEGEPFGDSPEDSTMGRVDETGLEDELDELFADFDENSSKREASEDDEPLDLGALFDEEDFAAKSSSAEDLDDEDGAETEPKDEDLDLSALFDDEDDEMETAGDNENAPYGVDIPEFEGEIEEVDIEPAPAVGAELSLEETEEIEFEEADLSFDAEGAENEQDFDDLEFGVSEGDSAAEPDDEEDLSELDALIAGLDEDVEGDGVDGGKRVESSEELIFDLDQEFNLDIVEDRSEPGLPEELANAGFEVTRESGRAGSSEPAADLDSVPAERIDAEFAHRFEERFSEWENEKQDLLQSMEQVRQENQELKEMLGRLKAEIQDDLQSRIPAEAARVIREEIAAMAKDLSDE